MNGGGQRRGDAHGTHRFAPPEVVSATVEGCEENAWIEGSRELWVRVARWSDRHDLFVCCDEAHERFGVALECNDGHPSMTGRAEWSRWPDFTRYLLDLYGGGDGDFGHAAVLAEETAYLGLNGITFGMHSDIIAPYIQRLGSDEQKRHWLPRAASVA